MNNHQLCLGSDSQVVQVKKAAWAGQCRAAQAICRLTWRWQYLRHQKGQRRYGGADAAAVQGWRLEIKAYPKLTEKGAWRGRAGAKGYGGFYTQDQVCMCGSSASRSNL